MWKAPKNSEKYVWTEHAKLKMRSYGLSGQRVTRVIRAPLRREEGVAGKGTIAVMQPQSTKRDADGNKTWTSEIWVMYKIEKQKAKNSTKDDGIVNEQMQQFLGSVGNNQKHMRIISAWRYPGKTEPGQSLPDEICDEIAEVL